MAAAAACGSPDSPESEEEGSADLSLTSSQRFDVNHLVEDEDILGGTAITAAQVQSFLESRGSYLATYREGGRSAAEIVVLRSQADGVSPLYMLARIQGESSLVESRSAKNVAHATGCACPDGHACAKSQEGAYGQGCGAKKWGGATGTALLLSQYREAFPTDGSGDHDDDDDIAVLK
jgi:hypothetical protein